MKGNNYFDYQSTACVSALFLSSYRNRMLIQSAWVFSLGYVYMYVLKMDVDSNYLFNDSSDILVTFK